MRWLGALRGWRAHAAAGALGVLSAVALPPMHAVPVLLLTVPGLLALLGAQARVRGAALVGFWFGFGHHLLGLYWITEAILVEAARFWWLVPLAVPALAAVMALFIAAPCAAARAVPGGWPRVLVLAGAWVAADLGRQFIATGFPWNPWGSVWALPGAAGDVFLQPAALVGVHGLTLATLLLAAAPALGRRAVVACGAVLAAWAGFGLWRLDLPAPAPPGVTVVLAQGNIPQGQKWDREFVTGTFSRYLVLTRDGLAQAQRRFPGQAAAVVWPETASPYLMESDPNARAAVASVAQVGGMSVPALIGSVRFDAAQRPRNSLMAMLGAGPPAAIYDKWHLVPFGEYQPDWFPLPIQIVPGGGFARGPGPRTLRVPGLPAFGALICYEAIFPAQAVDPTDRPDWLVNVTNDAWFGNSTGPRQHLAAARMRAVEEGLPLLRAANTGISAAFNALGREQGRLSMNVTGVLVVALPGKLPPPFFARFGLVVPAMLVVIATVIGMLLAHANSKRIKF
ncbi:apolipoprotein N-acyltransferase [Limobrevibacterium gyesilva]|uniref:Apolipoprotein N-acyltransferase n=1 Tax=Limobrevibacterium gyesilva TaxID=2991712 RepID=A0AA41YLI4_9PROT|nr:apolipoprotein N-acyltransferase [Limobrevibacterium gyesilva]MCW3474641.1 apolipoprotein N-acyltransferase [Limobrevibacterium gyesilva]